MKLPISRESLEVPVEVKDLVFCPSSGIFSGSSMTPSASKNGVFLAFSQPAFIIDTVNEAQPFLRLVGRDLKITQVNSHYLTFLGLL